jgi:hypothetical protein
MDSFNDQPIARGVGDTATAAIKTMLAAAMASTEKWVKASPSPLEGDQKWSP